MKTIKEIEDALENNANALEDEQMEDDEIIRIKATITALEWVLSCEDRL
jgi:hypothetical protein